MDNDIMVNTLHHSNMELVENVYSMDYILHIDWYEFDLKQWDVEYPCVDLLVFKQCLKELKLLKNLRIS